MTTTLAAHKVRWMIRRDLEAVLDIEFCYSNPWPEETFLACLRNRKCIGLVLVDADDRAVGYVVYELRKHSLHVLRLSTLPGPGVRSRTAALLRKLTSKLSSHRRPSLTWDVPERHIERTGPWLRAEGFLATLVNRGEGADGTDTITFEFRVPAGADF